MGQPGANDVKPLLRGWSHAIAALVAIAGLVGLVVITRHDTGKLVSMLVYGIGLVLLFGVSATYHVFNWPPRVKDWLRRADHATIFVFIAATYTPLAYNVLDGWWRIGVLAAIWICAIAGAAGAAPFLRIPRRLLASLY
ncbi:MAG: PAQR family membrane homeostasis protein TrhA, partial [Candidatus Limnocylindria bacterium]